MDGNLSDSSIYTQISHLNRYFEGHFNFELVKVSFFSLF
jgi:hypothetical protein